VKLISLILSFQLLSFSVCAKNLEIMSYNVENLFDTKHDIEKGEDKNDWTYLPTNFKDKKKHCNKNRSRYRKKECLETNWTTEKLDLKISQIKMVVKTRKSLPDFLALTEVENGKVVGRMAKALGYSSFEITNSPDKRGVDVALIYKNHKDIEFVKKREHILKGEYFDKKPSRNILEVEFLINKKFPLTIFVNHWPSLGNPTKTRIIAANILVKRVEQLLSKNKKHAIIATGDFNTIDRNHPHPFKDVLLKSGELVDLHESFMKDRSISRDLKKTFPLGSYFYGKGMAWNHLDRTFYSKNLLKKNGLKLIKKSYRIIAPEFITTDYKYTKRDHYLYGSLVKRVPFRYDHQANDIKSAGYSDHFPLVVKLKY